MHYTEVCFPLYTKTSRLALYCGLSLKIKMGRTVIVMKTPKYVNI